MKHWQVCLFVICTCFSCAFAAENKLTFESQFKELTAPLQAEEVLVEFSFENKSSEKLVIRKIDAPCACMFAKLEGGVKQEGGGVLFSPGEKGIVKGRFVIKDFKGTVEKGVVMWMEGDDIKNPSVKLVAKVHVPRLVNLRPQTLSWKIGGDSEKKVIEVEIAGEALVRLKSVRSSVAHFAIELKELEVGRKYEVHVTPKGVDQTKFGVLQIETDSVVQSYKTVQSYLMIKKK